VRATQVATIWRTSNCVNTSRTKAGGRKSVTGFA
jgi:hypothetical protein